MGQYFKAVFLNEDYQPIFEIEPGGLKLMAHSWVENDIRYAVCDYLIDNPTRLVWAGDYEDENTSLPDKLKVYSNSIEYVNSVTSEDYMSEDYKTSRNRISKKVIGRYSTILNHDKKEYVDLKSLPFDSDGYQVFALPLLTANSSGSGGSYYIRPCDVVFYGRWCGDTLQAVQANKVPDGYEQIHPQFVEGVSCEGEEQDEETCDHNFSFCPICGEKLESDSSAGGGKNSYIVDVSAIVPDEMIEEKLAVVGIEGSVSIDNVNSVLKELDLELLQSDILRAAILKVLSNN